jgi:stromal interaction molecule 1
MRLYSLCFIFHLLVAENNSEQTQIHGQTLCNTKEAEQAIKDLHDDLDEDDDGTISTTENNEFNDEYGNAGSISALIGDSDGRVSKEEFLKSWKTSDVYAWTVDDVIEWLKSPDLKLKTNSIDALSTKVKEHNISGKCLPLLSKNDQVLLKEIGVKQHLVRRKLMLKSMDAILFGPPVYDNTLKDFALALAILIAMVSTVFVINLKRENANFERRLAAEHERIAKLDSKWADFNDGNNTNNGDSDSHSTLHDGDQDDERVIDAAQFKIMQRENKQLRNSLDEAHKEIRRIQSGHSNFDQIQITSELKTLLRRCYDYECQGLKYRTEDALKIRNEAQEAYRHLQRANQSIFASVRMIHSPTQLTSMDQSIREAQQAFETVTTWKKDFHSRWKDLEKMFRVSFRIKEVYRESRNSPHNQSVGDRQSDHGSTNTAIRQGTKFFRKLSAVSEFSAILNNNRSIGKLWCQILELSRTHVIQLRIITY